MKKKAKCGIMKNFGFAVQCKKPRYPAGFVMMIEWRLARRSGEGFEPRTLRQFFDWDEEKRRNQVLAKESRQKIGGNHEFHDERRRPRQALWTRYLSFLEKRFCGCWIQVALDED